VTPHNARLSSGETLCEGSRHQNITHGVLVTYASNKTLNNALRFIDVELAWNCFEFNVLIHFSPNGLR
jgi:hypothetical protein